MNNCAKKEKALLIGTKNETVKDWEVEDSLEELTRLAVTAGAHLEGTFVQEIKKIDPALFIGKGKAEEIKEFISSHDIDLVIFDEELSPTQQSNLGEIFNTKTIDRTGLILDIFAQRAQSKEGKLQVELAQLTYTLPRLKGKGLVLSRLGGGIGTRGPGETQLEVDRRKIKERITRLKRDIDKVRKVRELHRQGRQSFSNLTVALIGYTNAGKSTLLNNLSHTGVLVENRLFSTLDPKVGVVNLPNNQKVFISDTVGFVNKLPHQLVAAFKATLENGVAISALTGEGIENLLSMIESFVSASMQRVKLKIPFAKGKTIGQILEKGKIVKKKYLHTGVVIEAEVNRSLLDSLKPYLE